MGLIEVKNVTKKYGDFYAVRNINYESVNRFY